MTTTGNMQAEFLAWTVNLGGAMRRILFTSRRGGYFFALTIDTRHRLNVHHTVLGEETTGYLERVLICREGDQPTRRRPERTSWSLANYASSEPHSARIDPLGSSVVGNLSSGRYYVEATLRGRQRRRFKGSFVL